MSSIEWWPLLAGLGLFLFGMKLMEEAISKLTGRTFKIFLRKHTANPVKAVASGTITTAILQSSTLVTLLVMSFTGAGIIGLKNGIGIILGANLGTTFTGWMVSLLGFKLNIQTVVLPVIALGGLGTIFLKTERLLHFSKFLMGFGFIFMGLGFMKDSFVSIAEGFNVSALQGKPLVMFLLTGFLLTAAIQSSSASVAIYLSALSAGILSIEQAVFMVMGSDLGTTVTAMIGTVNANAVKKKTGYAHLAINVIQVSMAVLFWRFYFNIINQIIDVNDTLIALVFFQSMMNLAGIVMLTPLLTPFTRWIDSLVNATSGNHSTYIDQTNPTEVVSAIEALRKELKLFAHKTLETLKDFFENGSSSYEALKEYENEITRFYLITGQQIMNKKESEMLSELSSAVRNWSLAVKDVKDVKHNYDALRNSSIDDKYGFHLLIKEKQLAFYRMVDELLNNPDSGMRSEARNLRRDLFALYNNKVNELFKRITEADIDYAGIMNLIREIGNSNELLAMETERVFNHKVTE
ncbi:MAG: Na/Pi cotransporter family protein [Bacteroidia bacterium]|nr:Na/Pi cotransporter family protein [Bacteroidia bacterium]